MSLIRQRRERRQYGAKVKKPMSPLRLTVLLLMVIGLIWWLSKLYQQ
jgi:hypothetical protein